MGHLKSSALLSSSYLPFTYTPTNPSSSSQFLQQHGETAACVFPVLAERRLPQPPRPNIPALPTRRSHRLPTCPGALPRQCLGRLRHFRIPGASALPVRPPPQALRSGRPEPRTRRQRGWGPREAGVVPGRRCVAVPPRQPVGPRSGHTRKWRGTRAVRRGQVPGGGARGSRARWRVWLRGGGAAAAAVRQLGFYGRRSGCVPGVERLRSRLGVKGVVLSSHAGGPSPAVACRRLPLRPL